MGLDQEAPLDGLTSLGWQIHDHLKEHYAIMFQDLKSRVTLNAVVLRMQSQATDWMQAWEIVKD